MTAIALNLKKVKASVVTLLLELYDNRRLTLNRCLALVNKQLNKIGWGTLNKSERLCVIIELRHSGMFSGSRDGRLKLTESGRYSAAYIAREYREYIASRN